MIARYQGHCAACDGAIHPGEEILSDPWRHAVCPEHDLSLREPSPAAEVTLEFVGPWPQPSKPKLTTTRADLRRALAKAALAGRRRRWRLARRVLAAFDATTRSQPKLEL